MRQRVKDVGESEGHPAIGWIGVESQDKITLPERELTSDRCFFTREFRKMSQEDS